MPQTLSLRLSSFKQLHIAEIQHGTMVVLCASYQVGKDFERGNEGSVPSFLPPPHHPAYALDFPGLGVGDGGGGGWR